MEMGVSAAEAPSAAAVGWMVLGDALLSGGNKNC